ncbi:MAG: selenoprotein B glycine/betaine/sarcosine/D-proline reductase [Gammaproteobacteria bacterium]|nr:MAG: selenoprotein B glycine/betaine/sarcosine/D-proline reductase [Gammaproteobacteria bacterium]
MVRLADVPEPERSVIAELECPTYEHSPFTPASAPAERHVALVSSAGFIVRGERPLLPRETGYRSIAASVADKDVLCSHVSTNFDRTGFQQDLSVMLPRDRLRELEQDGTIGKAAEVHYAFMGATEPGQMERSARELGQSMLALGVNTVVLAPV